MSHSDSTRTASTPTARAGVPGAGAAAAAPGRHALGLTATAVVAAALGAGAAVGLSHGSAPGPGGDGDLQGRCCPPSQIASRIDPGLVDVTSTLGYQQATAKGTGIVLTSNGEILTNNHVINGATSVAVTDIGNGKTYKATVVGYDERKDVAVLQLTGASGLTMATIGDSSHRRGRQHGGGARQRRGPRRHPVGRDRARSPRSTSRSPPPTNPREL